MRVTEFQKLPLVISIRVPSLTKSAKSSLFGHVPAMRFNRDDLAKPNVTIVVLYAPFRV